MMIRVRWCVATTLALGAVALVGFSFPRVQAQMPANGVTASPYSADGGSWTSFANNLSPARIPPQGAWAEVITATSRWIVVQNQAGQQFPIASDRIRQFLVRWPSSIDRLNAGSVIEVNGLESASNVVVAAHVDIYEADAQRLVSPTVQNLSGYNRDLTIFDREQQQYYGVSNLMTEQEFALPTRMHIVGSPISNSPIQIAIPGNNFITIRPSDNGMSVSQITLGNNSYARRGDLVYIIPENITPRGLDVTTLVLYKKIGLREFQP